MVQLGLLLLDSLVFHRRAREWSLRTLSLQPGNDVLDLGWVANRQVKLLLCCVELWVGRLVLVHR